MKEDKKTDDVRKPKQKWIKIRKGEVVTIKGAPAEVIAIKHNSIRLKFIGELGKSIIPS